MQENNFENQVQQKMDELTFNPSGEVWRKVAVAIAKRKKDRRVVAIIFLLFLLTGSAIFILTYQAPDNKINESFSQNSSVRNDIAKSTAKHANPQIVAIKDKPAAADKNSPKGNKIKSTEIISTTKDIASLHKLSVVPKINKKTGSATKHKGSDKRQTLIQQSTIAYNRDTKNKITYKTPRKMSVSISGEDPVDPEHNTVTSGQTFKDSAKEITPSIKETTITLPADINKRDRIETGKPAKEISVVTEKTGYKKDTSVKLPVILKAKNKWEGGLAISAGKATTQNSYLGIIGVGSSSDELKNLSAPNQSTGGTTTPGTPHIPSKLTPGFGYSLGVYIQKNISYKTNILIGLNYKTYTSGIIIGNRVNNGVTNFNSSDNIFYNIGSASNYKNNFHFIELPVVARFKLGKQNKLPIHLNAGFSIAQLIGSNALQFDTSSGTYYRNNALFNKTLASVSAGFLFSLPMRTMYPILIGPDINFSLNKIANTGLYKDHHYNYFGIRVQKTIGGIGKK